MFDFEFGRLLQGTIHLILCLAGFWKRSGRLGKIRESLVCCGLHEVLGVLTVFVGCGAEGLGFRGVGFRV